MHIHKIVSIGAFDWRLYFLRSASSTIESAFLILDIRVCRPRLYNILKGLQKCRKHWLFSTSSKELAFMPLCSTRYPCQTYSIKLAANKESLCLFFGSILGLPGGGYRGNREDDTDKKKIALMISKIKNKSNYEKSQHFEKVYLNNCLLH